MPICLLGCTAAVRFRSRAHCNSLHRVGLSFVPLARFLEGECGFLYVVSVPPLTLYLVFNFVSQSNFIQQIDTNSLVFGIQGTLLSSVFALPCPASKCSTPSLTHPCLFLLLFSLINRLEVDLRTETKDDQRFWKKETIGGAAAATIKTYTHRGGRRRS